MPPITIRTDKLEPILPLENDLDAFALGLAREIVFHALKDRVPNIALPAELIDRIARDYDARVIRGDLDWADHLDSFVADWGAEINTAQEPAIGG